jgi:hypothetical protein
VTVATGFAEVTEDGQGYVGVLTDSRISWADGRFAETAVKAHDLGARIAVISAGLAIVGPYAAELTRSIVETSAARVGEPPISLWDATRTFAYFAREVQRELRASNQGDETERIANEFVLAGFYGDGSPGVAYVALSARVERVQFWRPAGRELACFTIGASPAKDIVRAAYEDFGPGSRFSDPMNAVASAMLYGMRSEGEPFQTVGGGIAVGICTTSHARFVWPAVEVEGSVYYRGFRMPAASAAPMSQSRSLLRVEVDTNYAAQLDRRVEDAKHGKAPGKRQARAHECSIDECVDGNPMRRVAEPDAFRRPR